MKQKWFIVEVNNIWYTQAPAKFQYMDRFIISNIEYINVFKYFPRLRFHNIKHMYLEATNLYIKYADYSTLSTAVRWNITS